MIGRFLDKIFSGESIKAMASALFCTPIIIGIIVGIIMDNGILPIIIFAICGFIIGITAAFFWHVLGQILDYLAKISDYLNVLRDKLAYFSYTNTKTLFEDVSSTKNDVHTMISKIK
ncbi:MAG: hypothetical protein LUG94_06760 [Ruminococcus sp.]|nr:hypothetical protein [Ruminococcus sp.]